MRAKVMPASGAVWLSIALALAACSQVRAQSLDMKFQAFLLWGTDANKPPEGKSYQPVGAEIRQRLKDLPLKWTNWFEVNRVALSVPAGGVKEAPVSEKCRLNVHRLSDQEVEVCLIGKGKEVVKRKQTLPKGEVLVLGGNAPNATAWLVVLKRVD